MLDRRAFLLSPLLLIRAQAQGITIEEVQRADAIMAEASDSHALLLYAWDRNPELEAADQAIVHRIGGREFHEHVIRNYAHVRRVLAGYLEELRRRRDHG